RGQLVEVRRFPRHDALVIGADVEPANIIAHDKQNVWLLAALFLGFGNSFLHAGVGQGHELTPRLTIRAAGRHRDAGTALLVGHSWWLLLLARSAEHVKLA